MIGQTKPGLVANNLLYVINDLVLRVTVSDVGYVYCIGQHRTKAEMRKLPQLLCRARVEAHNYYEVPIRQIISAESVLP